MESNNIKSIIISECLFRMRTLGLPENIVNDFEMQGEIKCSSLIKNNFCKLSPEMKSTIHEIEKDGHMKVYHVLDGNYYYTFNKNERIHLTHYLIVNYNDESDFEYLCKEFRDNHWAVQSIVINHEYEICELEDVRLAKTIGFNGLKIYTSLSYQLLTDYEINSFNNDSDLSYSYSRDLEISMFLNSEEMKYLLNNTNIWDDFECSSKCDDSEELSNLFIEEVFETKYELYWYLKSVEDLIIRTKLYLIAITFDNNPLNLTLGDIRYYTRDYYNEVYKIDISNLTNIKSGMAIM